ncbi:hypothetical protein ACG94M_08055 [Acinetobacter guillouiae]|uniref:hypothetical protein n=1 Tax=Acinetobacter guillouiae TaxID=106649 RepID=UPI003AF50870
MNKELIKDKHELRMSRCIQSLSFLVPVKQFSADIDYSKKVTVAAILETALSLINCLDEISASELQAYFGLNDIERESLIEVIEISGFASMNENGCLTPTIRMREIQLSTNEKFLLDEVENYFGDFSVDLLTGYIQPKAEDNLVLGLHAIPAADEKSLVEPQPNTILTQQFPRFQQCSKSNSFKSPTSKLYRINRCEYNQISVMLLSFDIYLKNNIFGSPETESKIFGYSSDNEKLVSVSGLIPKVQEYLNQRQAPNDDLTMEHYCEIMQDGVFRSFVKNNKLDFRKLLDDNINYEDPLTKLLIGPCYLDDNKQIIVNWLEDHIKSTKDLKPILWRPGHDDLWGSSIRLKAFFKEVDDILKEYDSQLVLVLPGVDVYDEKDYKKRFKNIVNYSLLLQNADALNNVEIMLFDNDPGMAIVQYHVFINKELGVGGFSMPIGYITQNPILINELKLKLKNWAKNSTSIKSIVEYRSHAGSDKLFESNFKKATEFFEIKN